MLFISFMKAKPNSGVMERTKRRLDWTYPEGIHVIGEYWLATRDPEVVLVSEAEDALTVIDAINKWDDMFDVTVIPAITADVGMARAREELLVALA